METELYELLDTVAKIGLGGLITGVTAYFIASNNNDHDLKKEFIRKKFEMLDNVVSDATKIITACEAYLGILRGTAYKNELFGDECSDEIFKRLKSKDEEILKSLDLFHEVSGRLLILDLKEARDTIANIHDKTLKVRNDFKFSKIFPDEDSIKESQSNVTGKATKFYKQINTYLSSI